MNPLIALFGVVALGVAAFGGDPLPWLALALVMFMAGSRDAWTTRADA